MKKLCKKVFVLILLLTIFSTLLNITNVKATDESSKNVIIDNSDSTSIVTEPKIMKYDSITNTTTEVDLENLKEQLNLKMKSQCNFDSFSCEAYNPSGSTDIILNQPQVLSLQDNLQRVQNVNDFPYKTICRINFNGGCGTGVLVGKNVLITAAHIVYDGNNNKYENWVAQAAYSKNTYKAQSGWSQVYYYDSWMSSHNWRYDIAICILNEPIGNAVGYMGFQNLGDSILKSLPGVTLVGYTSEREAASHPYYSKGNVKSPGTTYFTTDCYSPPGFSGGPMINDETGCVLGINYGTDVLKTSQRTIRITSDIFNILSSLR